MTTVTAERQDTLVLSDDRRKQLIALTKCASKGRNARPVLENVAFDYHHAYATDSYLAGFVRLRDDSPARGEGRPGRLVNARDLAKALKVEKGQSARLTFEEDALLVEHGIDHHDESWTPTGSQFRLTFYEGTFPDIWALVPGPFEAVLTLDVFDPEQVSRIAALCPSNVCPVRLRQSGKLKVAVVEDGFGTFLGLVMPVRI